MMIDEDAVGLRFFRFLLPGFSAQMLIPCNFVKAHVSSKQKKCREKATLMNSASKIWYVDLYMKNNDLFMGGEDCQKFAVANGLQVGQLLVFRYRGNMVFSFQVFNPSTACEEMYSSSLQIDWKKNKTMELVVLDEDDDSDSIQEPAAKSCTVEAGPSKACRYPKERAKSKIRRSNTTEGHFVVVITDYHLKHSNTMIPARFRESSGISAEDKEVSIRDAVGRMWGITIFHRKGGRDVYMTNRWMRFARANKLEVGDRCVFELVAEGEKKVFSFKIEK